VEYPKRPKFFAYKFVRLMAKVCLANEIGPDACWLLTVIAFTEDASCYRRPVTYFNGNLMPICGFATEKTLSRARSRAVAAGWLNYKYCGTRRPGRYFVLVPSHAEGIDDRPLDEGDDPITDKKAGNGAGNQTVMVPVICPQLGSNGAGNGAGNGEVIEPVIVPPFSLCTDSIPSPYPNTVATPPGIAPNLFGEEEVPSSERVTKERPRDDLFDAIVEVTGADPARQGGQIGKLKKSLLAGKPPYTPAEVRKFAEVCQRECPWLKGAKPSLANVDQYIARVRPQRGDPGGGDRRRNNYVDGAGHIRAPEGKYDDLPIERGDSNPEGGAADPFSA
jgi:hypothetical protein